MVKLGNAERPIPKELELIRDFVNTHDLDPEHDEISEPRALFSLAGYRRARNRQQYDVAPGDQRFIMIKDPPVPPIPTVVLVENWFPELLAKVKQ